MSKADAAYQQGYDRGYALARKDAEVWQQRSLFFEKMLSRLVEAQVNLELNRPQVLILPSQCPNCGLELSTVLGPKEHIMPRARVRHEMKCWPEFFQPMLRGLKRFDLRRDDRPEGFQVGDELLEQEWDPTLNDKFIPFEPKGYTGRECLVRVDYIMPTGTMERLLEMNQNIPFPANGFVIMSVSRI